MTNNASSTFLVGSIRHKQPHPLSPHPGPLPWGEGMVSKRFGIFESTFCKSRHPTCDQPIVRFFREGSAILPLPKGEGRGEGEGSNRRSVDLKFQRWLVGFIPGSSGFGFFRHWLLVIRHFPHPNFPL